MKTMSLENYVKKLKNNYNNKLKNCHLFVFKINNKPEFYMPWNNLAGFIFNVNDNFGSTLIKVYHEKNQETLNKYVKYLNFHTESIYKKLKAFWTPSYSSEGILKFIDLYRNELSPMANEFEKYIKELKGIILKSKNQITGGRKNE